MRIRFSFSVKMHAMKSQAATILIVDDDPETHIRVQAGLASGNLFHKREAFKWLSVFSPSEARRCLQNEHFDLVLLDLSFVGSRDDGWDLLGELRRKLPSIPIVMLSGNDGEDARVRALRSGADDFVAKPFRARELTARIEAVLRRATIPVSSVQAHFPRGASLNLSRSCITLADGSCIRLTKTELPLLQYLIAHAPRAISRDELAARAYRKASDNPLSPHTVDVSIARIRKKIIPALGEILSTVYGIGYSWNRDSGNTLDHSDNAAQ